MINIESKTGAPGDESGWLRFLGFKRTLKWDLAQCASIDAEIKNVFGNELKSVLTPDEVRAHYPILDSMVISNTWPALNECRAK